MNRSSMPQIGSLGGIIRTHCIWHWVVNISWFRQSGFRQRIWAIALLLVGSIALTQCSRPGNVNLALGNPSNARSDRNQPDNYLIQRPQYALSYNNSKHIPNWVSWQLTPAWLGPVPRSNDFRPDDSLPEGWVRVSPADYTGSGYDRGHMTPAGDRGHTPEDNSATFLMTNIVPQAPDNNRGPWEALESYCRYLVKQGKELYIVSGGYGEKKRLARTQVVVPSHVWKVVLVLDQPQRGLDGVTENTRAIAVDMPNEQGIKDTRWTTYRVTVQDLEAKTGYSFLSNLPTAVQQRLKARRDGGG
jgi:endonuclease G, mitochondrial